MICPKKPKTRFVLLVLLSAFLAVLTIHAEKLPVKIYTSADGLGSSFVDFLFRDSRGFMWFCTRDGLSRFDGARFVTYQIGDKDSPPGIETIYESRNGIYWITTTGGAYRFDPNNISQTDSASPRLNAEFIGRNRGQFLEDSQGNFWFSTIGLSLIKEKDGRIIFEPYDLNLPLKENISFTIGEIAEAPDGSLWFNTNVGIVRLLPDRRTVYYPQEQILNSGNTSLMVDRKGYIWFTRNNLILVIKPEPVEDLADAGQTTVKTIEPNLLIGLEPEKSFSLPQKNGEIFQFTSYDGNKFIEKSYSKKIFQASDEDVWITAENYLLQFSDGVFHLHSDKEGLPVVMSRMAEDAAGNLWIGGYAGLARIDRHGMVTFGTYDGANSSRFFAINESGDGHLYFAAHDFFLNRFDGTKLTPLRPPIPAELNFLWTSRYAFLDSKNNWWILTGNKLFVFAAVSNFEDLRGKSPARIYSVADGLKSNGIFQIFEDSGGNIWVSTRDDSGSEGTGTARLKKGETQFRSFSESDGLPKGKSFSSAVEDFQGHLWFSFYGGGLARFDGQRFDFWEPESNLSDGPLLDLYLDQKNRLWIGSALEGLFRIDDITAPKPVFVHLTTDNGLTSNNIRTITGDKYGRIYIGTARGVDRLTPDTAQIEHYSVNDGLASDFVVDSHCDRNGNLWFATNSGISRLIPLSEEQTFAPRILLGGLRIAGEPQPVSQIGSSKIEKGELSAGQNNLQIEFFGLDFRAGETLRYQYKFEGSGTDWSLPSDQRTVNFANLSPDDYRFLVRAINSEGVTSEKPAVVTFKILPPVYARWWFIVLGVLLASAIVFVFYRYRLARLQEVNLALEEAKKAEEQLSNSRADRIAELERVRSRIATDLHDDIGASLTQIAILSEVAQAQSKGNGANESLAKITNVSNELVGTMSDIVWSINPSKDHLSDLTQRMRRFASDSLSAKGISLHFNSLEKDQEIVIKSNLRREVFLIFKESINNIVKHSQAKRVEIELNIDDENLFLRIKDDGKGFGPETAKLKSGFDTSLQTPETYPPGIADNSGNLGGNGILSMKKRAREMNGELEIISETGKGTTIELKLPMETGQTQTPNK